MRGDFNTDGYNRTEDTAIENAAGDTVVCNHGLQIYDFFILSAVLVVVTDIVPNGIGNLNIILSEVNISTVDNAAVYHTYCVTFGIPGGLFPSFFKSFRAFLRDMIIIT